LSVNCSIPQVQWSPYEKSRSTCLFTLHNTVPLRSNTRPRSSSYATLLERLPTARQPPIPSGRSPRLQTIQVVSGQFPDPSRYPKQSIAFTGSKHASHGCVTFEMHTGSVSPAPQPPSVTQDTHPTPIASNHCPRGHGVHLLAPNTPCVPNPSRQGLHVNRLPQLQFEKRSDSHHFSGYSSKPEARVSHSDSHNVSCEAFCWTKSTEQTHPPSWSPTRFSAHA